MGHPAASLWLVVCRREQDYISQQPMVLPVGSINELKKKNKIKPQHTHTACPSYSALRGVTEPAEPVGVNSLSWFHLFHYVRELCSRLGDYAMGWGGEVTSVRYSTQKSVTNCNDRGSDGSLWWNEIKSLTKQCSIMLYSIGTLVEGKLREKETSKKKMHTYFPHPCSQLALSPSVSLEIKKKK